MEAIQVIILLFAIFALSRAFLRLKDRQMALTAFLFWTGIWSLLIIVALSPSILTSIANTIGVANGTNLLVISAVMLLFYLIFRIYIRLEKTEKELSALVTELSIREAKKKN